MRIRLQCKKKIGLIRDIYRACVYCMYVCGVKIYDVKTTNNMDLRMFDV